MNEAGLRAARLAAIDLEVAALSATAGAHTRRVVGPNGWRAEAPPAATDPHVRSGSPPEPQPPRSTYVDPPRTSPASETAPILGTGQPTAPRLLSSQEAATLLGVSVRRVNSWADDGQLTVTRGRRGSRHYAADEVRALARVKGIDPPPPPAERSD